MTVLAVFIALSSLLFSPAPASAAQQPSRPPASSQAQPQQAPPESEARSSGLPGGLDWTFNFDAAWGTFGFMNSLYTNPKPEEPSGNLGDNWFEGSVKPTLTGTYTTASTWKLWGKLSAVGERTYGAAPSLVGEDASSFKAEDLAFGVRSGQALGKLGEDAFAFTVGRAQYQLGHGLLLWDGAAEGGTRGGYWTNARKAFAFASIARFQTGPHKAEAFYLKRDELPEADTNTRLAGINYEASLGESTTLGATYMRFWANDSEARAQRAQRLQPARVHGADSLARSAVLRGRVRAGEERRAARLPCLDAPGCVRARRGEVDAQAVLPLRVLSGGRRGDRQG